MTTNIPPRERDAAVQALRAGVVPRLGIRHVQVGRAREVEETVLDMTRIAQGGSAVRFVIGEYGSGKTFFLTLARNVAAEKKLVVMHADLSPERRLHACGGQARTLCAELVLSMSTRTKPDGGALASVLERFLGEVRCRSARKRDPLSASKKDPLLGGLCRGWWVGAGGAAERMELWVSGPPERPLGESGAGGPLIHSGGVRSSC
jgi:hypothetical protein